MRCKYFFKAVAVKARRLRKADRKLAKSYVSLFLVMVLILTFSFAWFTKRNTARMGTNLLEFQSASSLRINKDKSSANKITIPAFTLDEASSVDGRNIYFPLGASFTTTTADMFFREGNTGDENVHYVYKDFQLKGTSGNTPVYIKSYKITVADPAGATGTDTSVNGIYQDELKVENDSSGKPLKQLRPPNHCPIRLAFIADSGVRPVVIDPSAQVVDYADNSNAVTLVDDNGVPQLQQTAADSFSTYYYEHTPLFVIPGGQTLNVTLVVWLEGTLENSDKYIGKEISVDIDIESNFAEMDTITFVDGSYGDTNSNVRYWVSNSDNYGEPIIACSYEDPYSDETPKRWKTVIMRKTKDKTDSNGAEWQAEIPKKAYTNISFYRLTRQNGSNQATIYNAWHTRTGVSSMTNPQIPSDWYTNGSLQESRRFLDTSTNTYDNSLVYTAVHGNKYSTTSAENERLSPCVGYWDYSGDSGTSSGGGDSGGGESGGGSSSNTTCSTTVILRVPNDLSGKEWVWNTDTVGFQTQNGHSYYFDSFSNRTASKTFDLEVGDKIVKMIKHNSGGDYNAFSGGTATWTVPDSSTWTVTFTMDNNDHWSHN